MARTKILTITMEFQLGSRKAYGSRITAAYEAAEKAALEAVKKELLGGSLEEVRSTMDWSYRYGQGSNKVALDIRDEPEEEEIAEEGTDQAAELRVL
ncbi:hypothetical protein [Streptomyces phytohabitans]|uniref:hypothetical protein n=1 Tax=Streptomyces phytohabitans TaxID=1150371 RepID=UPI00345BF8F2